MFSGFWLVVFLIHRDYTNPPLDQIKNHARGLFYLVPHPNKLIDLSVNSCNMP